MKIRTKDGRVFQGTGLQIVQAMKSTAFGVQTMTTGEYIEWLVGNLERLEGVRLSASGADDVLRSDSLVRAMVEAGVASSL
jgi:hypothetical protein